MTEWAPAKINVCLFVGGTRAADGRHELVSVMQAVDLADDLRLAPATTQADEVHCRGVDGPNIVTAAIAAFRARTGWDGPPVAIHVTKRIPVAAGMAGGSADAAAALRLLARHVHHGGQGVRMDVSAEVLREIAAGLGADVPAQVVPGRWLATGAGEDVAPLAPVWPLFSVLVLPGEGALRTPDVYAELDRLGLPRAADDLAARLAEVRAATSRRPGGLPGELIVNDLQPAALSLMPSIGQALAHVGDAGADHALVSGSGPTVLGLFSDAAAARTAAQALRRHHPRLMLAGPVAAAARR